MFDGFALSIRGSSHIKENIARQDYAGVYVDPAGWALAAVADGHGGKDYFRSHIGARFAVEAAVRSLKNWMANKEDFQAKLYADPATADQTLRRFEESIISNWNDLTTQFDQDPAAFDMSSLTEMKVLLETEEDAPPQDRIDEEWEKNWIAEHEPKINEQRRERLYGCTLLAAVMAEEFCFCVQVGDGCSVAVYPDGNAEMMVALDEEQAANVTDSMCGANVLADYKHKLMLKHTPKVDGAEAEAPAEEPVAAEAPTAAAEAPEAPAETEETATAEAPATTEETAEAEAATETEETAEADEVTAAETEAPAPAEATETEAPAAAETAAPTEAPATDHPVPAGMIVSTDGLYVSFGGNDAQFLSFNRRVLSRMGAEGREQFGLELAEHLHQRSKQGSADDISMALVFDAGMDYEAVRPQ
jgi:serine/threonine protein phosphatase PrpC